MLNRNIIRYPAALLLLGGVLSTLSAIPYLSATRELAYFNLAGDEVFDADARKLRKYPSGITKSIFFINDFVSPPEGVKTLIFRPSDVSVYSTIELAGNLNPDYYSLFQENLSKERLFEELVALDIGYILTPGYTEPSIDNSAIGNFIGDPEYVDLLFYSEGARLMQVRKAEVVSREILRQDFNQNSLEELGWTVYEDTEKFVNTRARLSALQSDGVLKSPPSGLFNFDPRFGNTTIYNGGGYLGESPVRSFASDSQIAGASSYHLQLAFYGEGVVNVYLEEYSAQHEFLGKSLLYQDIARGDEVKEMLFRTQADTSHYRLAFNYEDGTAFRPKELKLAELEENAGVRFPFRVPEFSVESGTGNLWVDEDESIRATQFTSEPLTISSAIETLSQPPSTLRLEVEGSGTIEVRLRSNCDAGVCGANESLGEYYLPSVRNQIEISISELLESARRSSEQFIFLIEGDESKKIASLAGVVRLQLTIQLKRNKDFAPLGKEYTDLTLFNYSFE